MTDDSAPNGWQLQAVVSIAQATLESLRIEHGQIIETDESLLAALADENVGIEDIVRRLIRAALDAKANAAAAKSRMDDLSLRAARYQRHEQAFRSTALAVLESLGLTSFKDPEFSVSVRPGVAKLIVTDADALPEAYTQSVTTMRPDTAAIRAALDAGGAVPGATLSNGSAVLTIRSR